MNPALTLVVPVRLGPSVHQGEARLDALLSAAALPAIDRLIVDDGSEEAGRAVLEALADRHGARLVSTGSRGLPFSIGRARNAGVQHAHAAVAMFNDIDFHAPRETYARIVEEVLAREIASRPFRFFCVPVAFLSRRRSAPVEAAALDGGIAPGMLAPLLAAGALALADGTRITLGSSAMVVNRWHYLALGGHRREFVGHGAEDFELLHRLASYLGRHPRPGDYYRDTGSRPTGRRIGFRAHFADHGADLLAGGVLLAHLWHPERPIRDYKRKAENFALLDRCMRDFDATGRQPPPLGDLASGRRALVVAGGESGLEGLRHLLPHLGDLGTDASGGTARAEAADVVLLAGGDPGLATRLAAAGRTILQIDGASDGGRLLVRTADGPDGVCEAFAHRLAGTGDDAPRPTAFRRIDLPGVGAWSFADPDPLCEETPAATGSRPPAGGTLEGPGTWNHWRRRLLGLSSG